jgi:TonB family protein
VNWQEWSGRNIDGDISVGDYLGGSESGAIFSTLYASQKAVVRISVVDLAKVDDQLARLKTAESLSHPHLLKVLRSGRFAVEGTDYVYAVKEYAEENLWQVIPQRALTAAEAKDVLESTVDALAYLHGQGLVHGDIKPGNIMAAGEQLKLAVDNVRRDGDPLGRPVEPHDAPEAATAVSPRSDSWSLGMTLVEILTQQLPASNALANQAPAVPESVPAPFREIAQHCLLRTPELRWSMKDISDRLHAGEKKPAAAFPASTPGVTVAKVQPRAAYAGKQPSRAPFIVGAAIVLLIALVVGIPRLKHAPEKAQDSKVSETAAPPASGSTGTSQSVPEKTQAATENNLPEQKGNEPPAGHTDRDATLADKNDDEVQDTVHNIAPTIATKKSEAAEASVAQTKVTASPSHDGVVHEVLPEASRRALNTITGKVRVKVRVDVDASGNVVGSDFVSAGPSKYFANLAMQAARNWKFAPEQAQSRQWNLQFDFRRTEVQAFPTRVNR